MTYPRAENIRVWTDAEIAADKRRLTLIGGIWAVFALIVGGYSMGTGISWIILWKGGC